MYILKAEAIAFDEMIPRARSQQLEIIALGGDAPLQAFGYIDGYPWYFRARGNQWEFAVGNLRELSFETAIAATMQSGSGLLLSKRYPDTARLTEEKARIIIQRSARAALAFLE